ncbi:hypothetical protein C8F01DRAFT_1084470 [Mycena amicta]|nr:hypothetical protein C8F01DRAFT_1084470 [Mycena amicta]
MLSSFLELMQTERELEAENLYVQLARQDVERFRPRPYGGTIRYAGSPEALSNLSRNARSSQKAPAVPTFVKQYPDRIPRFKKSQPSSAPTFAAPTVQQLPVPQELPESPMEIELPSGGLDEAWDLAEQAEEEDAEAEVLFHSDVFKPTDEYAQPQAPASRSLYPDRFPWIVPPMVRFMASGGGGRNRPTRFVKGMMEDRNYAMFQASRQKSTQGDLFYDRDKRRSDPTVVIVLEDSFEGRTARQVWNSELVSDMRNENIRISRVARTESDTYFQFPLESDSQEAYQYFVCHGPQGTFLRSLSCRQFEERFHYFSDIWDYEHEDEVRKFDEPIPQPRTIPEVPRRRGGKPLPDPTSSPVEGPSKGAVVTATQRIVPESLRPPPRERDFLRVNTTPLLAEPTRQSVSQHDPVRRCVAITAGSIGVLARRLGPPVGRTPEEARYSRRRSTRSRSRSMDRKRISPPRRLREPTASSNQSRVVIDSPVVASSSRMLEVTLEVPPRIVVVPPPVVATTPSNPKEPILRLRELPTGAPAERHPLYAELLAKEKEKKRLRWAQKRAELESEQLSTARPLAESLEEPPAFLLAPAPSAWSAGERTLLERMEDEPWTEEPELLRRIRYNPDWDSNRTPLLLERMRWGPPLLERASVSLEERLGPITPTRSLSDRLEAVAPELKPPPVAEKDFPKEDLTQRGAKRKSPYKAARDKARQQALRELMEEQTRALANPSGTSPGDNPSEPEQAMTGDVAMEMDVEEPTETFTEEDTQMADWVDEDIDGDNDEDAVSLGSVEED